MIVRHFLSETQRGILQVALEIAQEKFAENARIMRKENSRIADIFDEQEGVAQTLRAYVVNSQNIIIEEVPE